MAVYGIPRLHEDDALRAVRGAAELGDALAELNSELEAAWGVRLALRTGVNTGEVVVGDAVHGQEIVVGDAVNVAARLEQAAGPGEVLIGEQTWRLVRDAVTVEPVAPLAVKGKGDPVAGSGEPARQPAAARPRHAAGDGPRSCGPRVVPVPRGWPRPHSVPTTPASGPRG